MAKKPEAKKIDKKEKPEAPAESPSSGYQESKPEVVKAKSEPVDISSHPKFAKFKQGENK